MFNGSLLRGTALNLLIAAVSALSFTKATAQEEPYIVVTSTTSTEASGLYEYILPKFEKKTGIDVRVVAVGTGAALEYGQNCDADVVLVHAVELEREFVAKGYGVKRYPLMYNDFVIVGPEADPAGIAGMDNASEAFAQIAETEATFMSRGDESGTNTKELDLWDETDADPLEASGTWYRETGSGMGETLNTTAAIDGYTLTDRGTWISFDNRRNLEILVEGDPRLSNPYGVILVNPENCPNVKVEPARKFMHWLTSDEGQELIASYRLRGQQLFHPSAKQVVPLDGKS